LKIMLVFPPIRTASVGFPLGLGYLASVLRQDGFEVSVRDYAKRATPLKTVLGDIAAYRPDVLGLGLSTLSFSPGREIIRHARALVPGVKIVIGGPQVSGLGLFSMKYTEADYGVMGEGEITMRELCRALSRDPDGSEATKVDGVMYRADGDGQYASGPPRPFVEHLDSLPFPAWDLMPPNQYPFIPRTYFVRRFPVASIITSRGCPYRCTFCASHTVAGRRLRTRSPASVVDEIVMLRDRFGVREIHFEDDNITFSKEHALGICRELLDRDVRMPWKCPNGVRTDRMDEELLRAMKQAGCYQVLFGIESASERILSVSQKGLDLKRCEGIIVTAKRMGFETLGLFMYGLPGETPESARETLRYSLRPFFDLAHYSLFVPIPGSRIFRQEYPTEEDLWRIEWDRINFFSPQHGNRREAALWKRIQRESILRFYLRPRVVAFMLRQTRLEQIPGLLRSFLRYFR